MLLLITFLTLSIDDFQSQFTFDYNEDFEPAAVSTSSSKWFNSKHPLGVIKVRNEFSLDEKLGHANKDGKIKI